MMLTSFRHSTQKGIIIFLLASSFLISACGNNSSSTNNDGGSIVISSTKISNCLPSKIVTGQDGNLWFICDNYVVKTTLIGAATEYMILTDKYEGKIVDIAAGKDGVWFTISNSYYGIDIDSVSYSGTIHTPINVSGVKSITYGPDGNYWFTENAAAEIGIIDPTGNIIKEYSISDVNRTYVIDPESIISGSDKNLWFTTEVGKIGQISLNGSVQYFDVSKTVEHPDEITSSLNGKLCFTDSIGNAEPLENGIGCFLLPNTSVLSYSINDAQGIGSIAVDAQNTVWFVKTKTTDGDCIGKILSTGNMKEYPCQLNSTLPAGAFNPPSGLTIGSDGNVWFVVSAFTSQDTQTIYIGSIVPQK